MKNALINRDLEEEIHIDISSSFDRETELNKVYKVKKTLYELKHRQLHSLTGLQG